MSTKSKATELNEAELDQVAGGVKMSDPKTTGTKLVGDDVGAGEGVTDGSNSKNLFPSRN